MCAHDAGGQGEQSFPLLSTTEGRRLRQETPPLSFQKMNWYLEGMGLLQRIRFAWCEGLFGWSRVKEMHRGEPQQAGGKTTLM